MSHRALIGLSLWLCANVAQADQLVLFAGGGKGVDNVPATHAKFNHPFGIDFDHHGNAYVAELTGERTLKVDGKGVFHIVAGTGKRGDSVDSVAGKEANFNGMHSLAVGKDGYVYLADTWNNCIRKLDPKTNLVTRFAGTGAKKFAGDGGPAKDACFNGVFCISFDPQGERLFITDLGNRRIRAIDMKSGTIETVAGNGKAGAPKDGTVAKEAPLVDPRAHAVDKHGNVYILERGGHALRVVDPQGKIRTVIGTGKAGNTGDGGEARFATLNGPKHLCIDHDDSVIIADTANHVIRRYSPKTGMIVRMAGTGKKGDSGTGGKALETPLHEPHGVTVHRDGTLYIVDSYNHRVFRLEK